MREKVFTIKALDPEEEGGAHFAGYLSTYGNTDREGDIFEKGSFDKSIAKKSVIPMCWNHQRNVVIGKMELSSDEKGLFVLGTFNMKSPNPVVQDVKSLLEMGAVDSMSVGFNPIKHEPIDPSRPFGGWIYKEVEALEGSVVTVPANEEAVITQHKDLTDAEREELATLRIEKRLARVNELIREAKGLLNK